MIIYESPVIEYDQRDCLYRIAPCSSLLLSGNPVICDPKAYLGRRLPDEFRFVVHTDDSLEHPRTLFELFPHAGSPRVLINGAHILSIYPAMQKILAALREKGAEYHVRYYLEIERCKSTDESRPAPASPLTETGF